jgi:hypothetical protein
MACFQNTLSLSEKEISPRLALNNNTAGVREREDANRTREAGRLNEIQGVVANTLDFLRLGASLLANSFGVAFIAWLDTNVP